MYGGKKVTDSHVFSIEAASIYGAATLSRRGDLYIATFTFISLSLITAVYQMLF